MGFFEDMTPEQRSALNAGLLQAGLGILAANDGRRSGLSAIGRGGLLGVQGYEQAYQQAKANTADNERKARIASMREQLAGRIQDEGKRKMLMSLGDDEVDKLGAGISARLFETQQPDWVTVNGQIIDRNKIGTGADPVAMTVPSQPKPGYNSDGTRTEALMAQEAELSRLRGTQVNVAPNFGQPQAVLGPDGQPALVQFGKGGQIQRADGYRPYSQKAEDAKQQKEQGAKSALDYLNEAEKFIDVATGSGIGSAVDSVGRVFGLSTRGSEAAARLRAIQGALMMAQPRMEGPQSDKDVALYREMAGNIGDPSIPSDEKRAAIETIRALHQKYVGANNPAPGGPVKFLGFE